MRHTRCAHLHGQFAALHSFFQQFASDDVIDQASITTSFQIKGCLGSYRRVTRLETHSDVLSFQRRLSLGLMH